MSLLSHAGTCSNFAFLSLVLLGEKGYELLLNTYPLIEIDPSLKRAFGKLKQLLKISNEVFKAIFYIAYLLKKEF